MNEKVEIVWDLIKNDHDTCKYSHIVTLHGVSIVISADEQRYISELRESFSNYGLVVDAVIKSVPNVFVSARRDIHQLITDLEIGHSLSEQNCFSSVVKDSTYWLAHPNSHLSHSLYILMDPAHYSVVVSYDSCTPDNYMTVVRIVRGMLMMELARAGWLFLHASAVGTNNRAIAIVGEKFSGKTTTMLSLVEKGGLSPITNDTLAYRITSNGIDTAGFPIRAGIRLGTLAHLPVLMDMLRAEFTPDIEAALESKINNIHKKNEKLWISLKSIADGFGCSVMPSGSLRAIVSPVYDQMVETSLLQETSAREAQVLLKKNFLEHPQEILSMQSFLLPMYSDFSSPNDNTQGLLKSLETLIEHVPIYWLIQNKSVNKQVISRILNLITRE